MASFPCRIVYDDYGINCAAWTVSIEFFKLVMIIESVRKSTCYHDKLAPPEMGFIFCSNVENKVHNWLYKE